MNEKLEECIYQCEKLKIQMERDCQLPSGSLGGEMSVEYRKLKECQLMRIKKIATQLRQLQNNNL